ncbi:breast carcinoma-amplified sequence 1-like [Castor canadensis]|uniref:Breast carcinoma-amplified sequence 1-like n=1 Tax=Castor canadensis TaxID=51338 RepID=A0AC58K242_CASCN
MKTLKFRPAKVILNTTQPSWVLAPRFQKSSIFLAARGKNLGKEAKPEAPAAKSRFFLTLSRPVPGRPGDQGLDSSATPARLDGSSSTASTDKDPSERKAHPAAAVPRPAGDKTPGQTLAGDQAQAATCQPAPLPPESGAAAPSKPKDSSFFDKFFKLDKGQEKAPVESQEQVRSAEHQDQAEEAPGPTGPTDGVSTREDVVDGKETEGQQTEIWNCSGPGDPEGRGIAKEDSQTTDIAENSSIMSFFKTLVSPNKAETKKDPEDVGTETTSTTSANLRSDKGNFTPQETQVTPKSPKGCSPPGHTLSATASDTTKEGGKEKSGTSSLPLGKLFRKKSVKEDSVPTGAEENVVCESPVEILKFEKVESASQTVDLNEEKGVPEPAEVKLRGGESKPRRTSLMSFFRQMKELALGPECGREAGISKQGKYYKALKCLVDRSDRRGCALTRLTFPACDLHVPATNSTSPSHLHLRFQQQQQGPVK